jgi:hypothetical protein
MTTGGAFISVDWHDETLGRENDGKLCILTAFQPKPSANTHQTPISRLLHRAILHKYPSNAGF